MRVSGKCIYKNGMAIVLAVVLAWLFVWGVCAAEAENGAGLPAGGDMAADGVAVNASSDTVDGVAVNADGEIDLYRTPAGTVLTDVDPACLDAYFVSYEIGDELFDRIYGLSYKEDCTVPREDLRYLKVLHYNFSHETCVGELMVNALLADEFLEIFRELYDCGYEIEKMHLVDDYQADDTESVENNNTSCFNFRAVTGGGTLSNHATGRAVDINPQQNPYIVFLDDGSMYWYHSNANEYIDRSSGAEHVITEEDDCYRIFTEHGFEWGGHWNNPIDYQHFEKEQ